MKRIELMFVLVASLVFGACSTDDDNNNDGYTVDEISEAPVWQVDWNNDQERPNWTEPNASAFEHWTIMMVQVEEALAPYVSEGDLMAMFINDELRGLASPAVSVGGDESISNQFLMKAYGNESGSEMLNVSLRYYCQKLKHMFTLSDKVSMNSDESTGIDEDYILPFTLGSAKFPVTKTVDVDPLLSKISVKPAKGDIVGAFVGEECRGTATISATGSTSLLIRCRTQGELITLKYYDNTEKKLYTIRDIANL